MATCSFGPAVAAARCQARRSGSTCAIGHLRQRQVDGPAIRPPPLTYTPPSAPADAERHAVADREQALQPRRRPRLPAGSSSPSHARQSSIGSPKRLSRGDQQQAPSVIREWIESPDEALLDLPGQCRVHSSRTNPPASCVAVNPRGSSSRASGLPRVSATIWSRTRSSILNGTTVLSRRGRRRSPRRPPRGPARLEARRPAPGRRRQSRPARPGGDGRQSASVSADVSSSHCASSTRHSSGRPQRPPRTDSTPPARGRKRSGASPVLRPNTTSMAWRCGVGMLLESDRAAARTAGGDRRSRAPSPAPPPPPGRR